VNWYHNKKQDIDWRLAYDGAGTIGEGIRGVGKAMIDYDNERYKRQNDESERTSKNSQSKLAYDGKVVESDAKKYVADKSFDESAGDNTTALKVSKDNVTIGAGHDKAKVKSAELEYEGREVTAKTADKISKRETGVKRYVVDTTTRAETKLEDKKSKHKKEEIRLEYDKKGNLADKQNTHESSMLGAKSNNVVYEDENKAYIGENPPKEKPKRKSSSSSVNVRNVQI